MDAESEQAVTERASTESSEKIVTAYETKPGRVVFTEIGNVDGWIATDLIVDRFR